MAGPSSSARILLYVIAAVAGVLATIIAARVRPNLLWRFTKRGRKPAPRLLREWLAFWVLVAITSVAGGLAISGPGVEVGGRQEESAMSPVAQTTHTAVSATATVGTSPPSGEGARWGVRYRDVTAAAGVEVANYSVGVAGADYDLDGYPDIYVANYNADPDTLYRNNRDGTFVDAGENAGIVDEKWGVGAIFCDLDNDGAPDIYASGNRRGGMAYRNNGDGSFTEVTTNHELAGPGYCAGAVSSDYNSDGCVDLFVLGSSGSILLYRGTCLFGLDSLGPMSVSAPPESHALTFGDYDGDGDGDLYVVGTGKSVLYRNDGGGTFADVTERAGVGNSGDGRDALWGDYDNDGRLDLYVVNYEGPNTLYHNEGNSTFRDVTALAGLDDTGSATSAAFGDYNGDGFLDIYVANDGQANTLHRNNGDGTFTNVVERAGVGNGGDGRDALWGDYDNDGGLDLYVVNYEGPNTLYHNEGNSTFRDVTALAGLDDTGSATSAAFGDYNGDGFLDIYVANDGQANTLYRNDGDGTFSNATEEAGVGYEGPTVGVLFEDLDQDGYSDIFLVAELENVLYRNRGEGTFSDVTNEHDLSGPGEGMSSTAADYDLDGDLDLYSVVCGAANVLWRNDGGFLFTDVTEEAGVGDRGLGRGATFGDYDGDGLADLYVANEFGCNVLYHNNGDGTFADVTRRAGVGVCDLSSFGAAFGDYDNDGDLDLYVTNVGANSLFRNESGVDFTDVSDAAGVANSSWSTGSAFADCDNDGDLDIVVGNKSGPLVIYSNDGDGTFTDVSTDAGVEDIGWSEGLLAFDYDVDGDVDLYLASTGLDDPRSSTSVLLANSGSGGNWIAVSLVSAAGGPSVVLARVEVTAGDFTQTQYVSCGSGYASSQPATLHFGVGKAELVKVVVVWPGGLRQQVGPLRANQRLVVVQPAFVREDQDVGVDPGVRAFAAAAADYDGDGDQDLYAVTEDRNVLYRNNGRGMFVDVAEEAGVEGEGRGRGAAWGDYDNDGRLDLYVVNSGGRNALYHNEVGGTFADVTSLAGVSGTGAGTSAVFGDYDSDGFLDIFVANHGQANALYRNNGDGTFENVAGAVGVPGVPEALESFGAVFLDYDGDSDLDLYVAKAGANALYENAGGTFRDVAGEVGVADTSWSVGCTSGDYNGDGFVDLYVVNKFSANRLFLGGGGGSFVDATGSWGAGYNGDGRAACSLDFDNDADLDILVTNNGANVLYRNKGSVGFEDVAAESDFARVSWTEGCAVADFDGDGYLDVYLATLSGDSHLYKGVKGTNGWVEVVLTATAGNRFGAGAAVRLVSDGGQQLRQALGDSGHGGQGNVPVHFGLGQVRAIRAIEVVWPDGVAQTVENVRPNSVVVVRRTSY